MKQKRHASSQTRYFRKDYKPATFAASQKKINRKKGKTSRPLKKVTTSTSRSVGKVVQATKKATAKVATSARKLTRNQTKATRSSVRSGTSRARLTRTNRKSKREPMTWREITLLSQVGVSVAAIIFTFAFCSINDPVKRSQNELERLATAYYIEHLYPATLGKYLYRPEMVLAKYTASGLPSVRLRQLLLFNNGRYASSAEVFSNSYYQCNVNETRIDYYPVEPYGPRDVTITFNKACEKVGAL